MVWNLLPRYQEDTIDVSDDDYAADIDRIRKAFSTDSKTQREKLLDALRQTSFVMVVDPGDGVGYVAKPGGIYIATERLKQLFAGVPGVFIVDDAYPSLRGEEMRELLEACGALRYPRPEKAPTEYYWSDRLKALRVRAGHADSSGQNDHVDDWTLQGFEGLLELLPTLTTEQRVERARLIWESLGDLEERRGRGIFDGAYSWTHHGRYVASFPSAFVRTLNETAWVPDATGDLVSPSLVVFETLGWKGNPFLFSKIAFKPPIIDQLAREAGIDPAALDLLRKHGITSVAALISRLGITDQIPADEEPAAEDAASEKPFSSEVGDATEPVVDDVYGDAKDLYGDDMPDIPPGTPDPDGGDGEASGIGGGGQGTGSSRGIGNGAGSGGHRGSGGSGGSGSGTDADKQGKRTPGSDGGRPFISYLGTHTDAKEADPDGLDQKARMKIEQQAVDFILSLEPRLERAPDCNPGFDLSESDGSGRQVRWVEVKSMTGSLESRPVGISRPQFDFALAKGDAFWLYVVEHASDPTKAQVLRIQNPVAHARTFTFDNGWRQIARSAPPCDRQEMDSVAKP